MVSAYHVHRMAGDRLPSARAIQELGAVVNVAELDIPAEIVPRVVAAGTPCGGAYDGDPTGKNRRKATQ